MALTSGSFSPAFITSLLCDLGRLLSVYLSMNGAKQAYMGYYVLSPMPVEYQWELLLLFNLPKRVPKGIALKGKALTSESLTVWLMSNKFLAPCPASIE